MKQRRKLFSTSSYIVRRKLFSDEEGIHTRVVKCRDCGFEMETAASTSSIYCPKCGGKRFDDKRVFFTPEVDPVPVPPVSEKKFSRISLFKSTDQDEADFQKSFSEPNNTLEYGLKTYSGKVVNANESEKLFGIPAEEMVEKGFAAIEGDNLNISSSAFLQTKLFSKLIVSVTKILDLDPNITCSCEDPECREHCIDNLEANGGLNPKGIILIKKAHGLIPIHHEPDCEGWAHDSGIMNDLKVEFGGRSLGEPEFKRTLDERYPDAPSGILDLLTKKGIIKLDGNNIEIIK